MYSITDERRHVFGHLCLVQCTYFMIKSKANTKVLFLEKKYVKLVGWNLQLYLHSILYKESTTYQNYHSRKKVPNYTSLHYTESTKSIIAFLDTLFTLHTPQQLSWISRQCYQLYAIFCFLPIISKSPHSLPWNWLLSEIKLAFQIMSD